MTLIFLLISIVCFILGCVFIGLTEKNFKSTRGGVDSDKILGRPRAYYWLARTLPWLFFGSLCLSFAVAIN